MEIAFSYKTSEALRSISPGRFSRLSKTVIKSIDYFERCIGSIIDIARSIIIIMRSQTSLTYCYVNTENGKAN